MECETVFVAIVVGIHQEVKGKKDATSDQKMYKLNQKESKSKTFYEPLPPAEDD